MATIKKAPRGKLFGPGNPGRPKGSLNKATIEVRELARRIVADPEYLENLATRVNSGQAAHMENLLWHYAHGKPTDKVEVSGANGAALFGGLKIEVVQATDAGDSAKA